MRLAIASAVVAVFAIVPRHTHAEAPSFGAVSIHRDLSGSKLPDFSLDRSGLFRAQHVTALDLIRIAYKDRAHVPEFSRGRIVTPLKWLDEERFVVEAQGAPGMSEDDLALAFRPMVASRFHADVQFEVHIAPAYSMTLVKQGRTGAHLAPSTIRCVDLALFGSIFMSGGTRCPQRFTHLDDVDLRPSGSRLLLGDVTMDQFAWVIERSLTGVRRGTATQYVDAPWAPPSERRVNVATLLDSDLVVNDTGLDGAYDAAVVFTTMVPNTTPNFVSPNQVVPGGATGYPPDGVSLFSALREQLGLAMKIRRVPVEFLRIDAASFPVLN